MKNFKKILCVVLAALMVSSSLVACKKKPSKPNGDTSSTSSQTKATGINVVGYMKNTDGTPLSGVTLQFGTDGKHAAVTDENGYFLFSGVEAGKYTLELLSSGMSMAKQEVTIVLGEVEAVADNVFTTDKNGIALNITLSGSGFVFELNTDIKVPETSSDTSSASGSGNGSGNGSNSSNVSNPNSSPVDESGKVDRTAVWTGDQNFKPGKYYGNLPKSQFRDGAGSDLTYGLWCWSTSLFMPDAANNEAGMDINMLLDMCIQNKFNEIYLSMLSKLQTADQIDKVGADSGKYSEMALRGFIKKCSEYGIKVYALEGEGGQGALKWFETSDKRTEKYIETIKKVNANAKSDSEKIAGLHLDVEAPLNDGSPTSPVSKQRYQKAMDYFVRTAASCKEAGIVLQFDNNAWSQDIAKVNYNGSSISFLDGLTRTLDNLTLMAYRHSAASQWNECGYNDESQSNEIRWGAKNGCNVLLGAELGMVFQMSPTEYMISYDAHGKDHYLKEMVKLRDQMLKYRSESTEAGARNARMGAAVHHSTAFLLLMRKTTDRPGLLNDWQKKNNNGQWADPPLNPNWTCGSNHANEGFARFPGQK